MQVGDALVRVDHGKVRAVSKTGIQVSLDLGRLVGRQRLDFFVGVTNAVVGIDTEFFKHSCILFESILVVSTHAVAEHDRV